MSTALHLERRRSYRCETENGGTITHDGFLRWLHFCLTGQNHPVILPRSPAYIDTLVGNKYVMVAGIDNFPFESSPGVLSECH